LKLFRVNLDALHVQASAKFQSVMLLGQYLN